MHLKRFSTVNRRKSYKFRFETFAIRNAIIIHDIVSKYFPFIATIAITRLVFGKDFGTKRSIFVIINITCVILQQREFISILIWKAFIILTEKKKKIFRKVWIGLKLIHVIYIYIYTCTIENEILSMSLIYRMAFPRLRENIENTSR